MPDDEERPLPTPDDLVDEVSGGGSAIPFVLVAIVVILLIVFL